MSKYLLNNKKIILIAISLLVLAFVFSKSFFDTKGIRHYAYFRAGLEQFQNKTPFIGWCYLDGFLNERKAFSLLFWIDSNSEKSVELYVYDIETKKGVVYREVFKSEDVIISDKESHIFIGGNSIIEKDGVYYIKINIDGTAMDFKLVPRLPGFSLYRRNFFRNFYIFPYIVPAPEARIKGHLKFNNEKILFDGSGYLEQCYFPRSTFKKSRGWFFAKFTSQSYTALIMQPISDRRALALVYGNGKAVYASFIKGVFNNIEEEFRNVSQTSNFHQLIIPVGRFTIYIKDNQIFRKKSIYTKFLSSFKIKERKDRHDIEEEGIGFGQNTTMQR